MGAGKVAPGKVLSLVRQSLMGAGKVAPGKALSLVRQSLMGAGKVVPGKVARAGSPRVQMSALPPPIPPQSMAGARSPRSLFAVKRAITVRSQKRSNSARSRKSISVDLWKKHNN